MESLRKIPVGYDIPPALAFVPAPSPSTVEPVRRNQATPTESQAGKRPDGDDALAFLPVTELSTLIRTRQVTSTELTKLYLARLKRFDPLLKAVVTFTEDLALKQAAKADAEITAGIYRGPLHGIPWGAKDLIAYPGYPTTWGATPFKDRVIDEKATVAARLEEAGAVLVAKTTLGALANGDRWQGGRTRSPWDPRRGSSGSSAGSASTVAAGLVGFAIGSETLGSIVSPCRACGASGLRPTFGRVSRAGCMTLAWSTDKLGPITRSMEDTALVLDAIHGSDGLDISAVDRPFHWPDRREIRGLKVGYFPQDGKPDEGRDELRVLKELGVTLVPIALPKSIPRRRRQRDARRRGGHRVRRPDSPPRHRRLERLAVVVPGQPVRVGGRIPPRGPGPNPPDEGDGRPYEDRRPLCRWRRPGHHQPHRPPDRRLPPTASPTETAAPPPARSPSPANSTANRP